MSIDFTPSGGIDRRSVALGSAGLDAASDPELARVVGEEERSLGRVQKHLAARKLTAPSTDDGLDYDAELLSLRDQIQEARLEDVPPLIEEMERLTEVAARRGKVTEGAVDPLSPYFGRMVLEETPGAKGEGRRREVLIGKATYLDPRTNVRIVDWRDAPVSRLYYRYEEGDEYEERFGGRDVLGEIVTRRSVAIGGGQLRRIGSPQGIFVRTNDGAWRRAGESARLHGGQGAAMRPEGHHAPAGDHRPGRLGVRIDDGRDEKFLPEITALIDPRQFELITRGDAGLVVIQGGAGSGKTTIGLHRLAYLAFQDPKRFRADKMLVMVFNDALVRYISRVLPALGVNGVGVVTFERWAAKLRTQHLRGLPAEYHGETPSPVTRLKKHPVMLRLIDAHVAKVTQRVEALLEGALAKIDARSEAMGFWKDNERAPLAVRLHRLRAWASPSGDGADAELAALDRGQSAPPPRPAPRSVAMRHAIERTVTTARRELLDVSAAWAEILTDEAAIRAAFAQHAPDALDDEDMRTALAWCTERCALVMAELEARREDTEGERTSQRPPAAEERERTEEERELAIDDEGPRPKLVARRKASDDDADDDDDGDDRSVGIDGAAEVEPPRLDREDDALLLRITQRLRGPLVAGRSQKGKPAERLRYEHILVDEAQDLSPVELAVVMGTSSKQRSVTLAGDTAQRLHMDNGFESWEQLLEAIRPRRPGGPDDAYPPINLEPLKVQYRSTHPIIELAQDVLGPLAKKDTGHAIRGGAPVELFRFAHSGEAVGFLGEALRELMQAEPRSSIAVIARYPEQADLYFKGLVTSEVPHLRRIAEQDFPFKPGIDVTDVRQVKGLEFDYVVLLEAGRASYPVNDESRHLLHIAATRAAHQLWITCVGDPSDILPKSLVDRAY
ncbi:MAG: 3'-5' exonuclease [Sandaracinus sp.]